MTDASVVVCTRGRPELLARCLEALSRLDPAPFELLVVDNAPRDDRAERVAAAWKARYLVEPVAGLSRARNLGARACRCEIVAFIDDDAQAEPGWLSGLAREFEDPAVMAVSGRILPGGAVRRRVVDRGADSWFEICNFGGVGVGASMAFRRSAFGAWAGFDVRLGRGAPLREAEEHHAFFSLVKAGHRVVYAPEATVRHPPARPGAGRALSAAGYLAFLLITEPSYRWRTAKYAIEALAGKRRAWRS